MGLASRYSFVMEKFGSDLVLLERLAAGGMAEVFRGLQIGYGDFKKTVAIKRILPQYAGSEDFKQMFQMEANLSGMLSHPNIAQIYVNGEFQEYLYLVMEYVQGKNLRQLLGRADREQIRIPIELSCFIVCEAAKGLAYAHRFKNSQDKHLGIVHRDMSPQNIMLGYEGEVKIVDFGIAKATQGASVTRAGVLKGKFGYMSPEQAMGRGLDQRSDIFSLGIILWELLTQRRLFSAGDDMRTLNLVRQAKVPPPSRKNPLVSHALDRIVLKALSKERSGRYQKAEDFYKDLFRYLSERHQEFYPTDLSKFLRKVYEKDILKEQKKREKIDLEAEAQNLLRKVQAPKDRDPKNATRVDAAALENATVVDRHEETLVSNADGEVALPAAEPVAESQAFSENNKETQENTLSESFEKSYHVLDVDKKSLENSEIKVKAVTNKKLLPKQRPAFSEKKPARKTFFTPPRIAMLSIVLGLVAFLKLGETEKAPSKELTSSKTKTETVTEVKDQAQQLEELPSDEESEGRQLSSESLAEEDLAQDEESFPEEDLLSYDSQQIFKNSNEVPQDNSPKELLKNDEFPTEEVEVIVEETPDVELESAELEAVDVVEPVESAGRKVSSYSGPTGRLGITVFPDATRILFNGTTLLGEDGQALRTPTSKLSLPVGIHKIELINDALQMKKTIDSLEVKKNRMTPLSVILDENF